MATYEDARSCGGKIVTKNRRRFNPYERPPPPQPPPPTTSSNWFSGVILPASRRIASGALNIISSVFDSDEDDDDDSSGDSACEDEAYEANDHDISSNGVDELNLETGTPNKELQLSVEKSERKHVIEQLLMEETFSREESERLVNIINSRVVPSDRPGDAIGSDSLDLCEKAVTEARNWIKERKFGQSSVSEFGTPGVYSARLQHIESKVASPVDMAKLYMNALPPWASPSIEHVELRTPSMLLRDGSGDSCSQSKRNSCLASGSWNIQDELRKVRSKATENMLQTLSSAQVDLSPYAPSSSTSQKYTVTGGVVAMVGDIINVSNSPIGANPVDESAELTGGATTKLGFSAFEKREDGFKAQGKQDSEAIHNIQIEGGSVNPKSHQSDSSDHTAEQFPDPNLSSENGYSEKEVKETAAETQNDNGLPSSQASLSTGGISDEQPGEGEGEGKDSGGGVHVDVLEKCLFSSEASIEELSQNSIEQLSQEQKQQQQPETGKQQRKNPSRTSTRRGGRARGK